MLSGLFFLIFLILPAIVDSEGHQITGFFEGSVGFAETDRFIPAIKWVDHSCDYPFEPSNIISILIYYKQAMRYITFGEERCAWHFKKELEGKVRDSWILPKGCIKAILKDLKDAKDSPEKLKGRLDYY